MNPPANENWVRKVMQTSFATSPPPGVFTRPAVEMADAGDEPGVAPGGLTSWQRMVLFHHNRGGRRLSDERKQALREAIGLLSQRRLERRQQPDLYDQKTLLPLAEKAADGEDIPDRQDYGDLSKVRAGQLLDWVVQRHEARRAGLHHDVRFGGEDTGLYSWAVRKGLPQPGQKHLAVQQPLHSSGYQSFEGEIPSGYGAGRVTKHDQGKVLVTQAGPEGVHFSTAHRRFPDRYALVPYPKAGERQWLMLNTTKTEPIPYQKKRYVKVPADQAESVLANLAPGSSVQEKIDGAASLTKLYKDHAEVASYRARKDTGGPIVHTERLAGGRIPVRVPRGLAGSVLRGELYGVGPDSRAIPPQQLGGLLNSGIAKSLEAQRAGKVRMHNMLFDIQQHGNTPVENLPYPDRRAKLLDVAKTLPPELFPTSTEATTPEAALAMWKGIREGTNPLTREGVVIHPPSGPPKKIKLTDEHDVHVREFFPGQGKYQGVGVGGFRYSHTPDGPIVGKVGGGLSDETRRMMHEDPSAFVGRVARVRAQEKLPSGALRAPSLVALHEDYPLAPVVKQAADRALGELGITKKISDGTRKSCHAQSYYSLGALKQGTAGQVIPQESPSSSAPSTLDNNCCLNRDSQRIHPLNLAACTLHSMGLMRDDAPLDTYSQGELSDFAKEARRAKKKVVKEVPTSPPEVQMAGPFSNVPERDNSGTENQEIPEIPVKPPAYKRIEGLVGGGDGQVGQAPTPGSLTPETELATQPIAPSLSIGHSVRSSQRVPSPLQRLLEAKAHSDVRRYAAKHSIMRSLITERPGEFAIDSENRGFVGVTHAPTGFRMHLPQTAVPALSPPIRRIEGASE